MARAWTVRSRSFLSSMMPPTRKERTVSAEEAMAMAQEQLAALEERTFAGMEVLQREVSGQELPGLVLIILRFLSVVSFLGTAKTGASPPERWHACYDTHRLNNEKRTDLPSSVCCCSGR